MNRLLAAESDRRFADAATGFRVNAMTSRATISLDECGFLRRPPPWLANTSLASMAWPCGKVRGLGVSASQSKNNKLGGPTATKAQVQAAQGYTTGPSSTVREEWHQRPLKAKVPTPASRQTKVLPLAPSGPDWGHAERWSGGSRFCHRLLPSRVTSGTSHRDRGSILSFAVARAFATSLVVGHTHRRRHRPRAQ